jgi:uncharacterized protein YdbL (DUF1318 family)
MTMKKYFAVLLALALGLGCARVRVEAPKEPIKVDVSMRLDIYQHIEKDIDKIENMVTGSESQPPAKGSQSFLGYFVAPAYAEEGLSPEVDAAIASRKNRRAELVALEAQGILGENQSGLVEVKKPELATPATAELVQAENQDRMIIYDAVAVKNGSSVREVQRLYAKRLQADAPAGTPIEVVGEDGASVWQVK